MILKFQMKEEVIHSYLLAVCQQQVKYYSLRQRDYQINYLVVTEVCQWDSFKYTTYGKLVGSRNSPFHCPISLFLYQQPGNTFVVKCFS